MRIALISGLAATLIVIGTACGSAARAQTVTGEPQNSSVRTVANSAQYPFVKTVTNDPQDPFINSGNNPAQGRYYDDEDKYTDWRTGLPIPGTPGLSGGGDG